MSRTAPNTKQSQESIIEQYVGPAQSHWVGTYTWIPAEGSHFYSTDELRTLYSQECTLFVGDSLQRRAADTLHILLNTRYSNSEKVLTDEMHAGLQEETLHNYTTHNSTPSLSNIIHTPVVQEDIFTDEYFRQKKHDRGFAQRTIEGALETKLNLTDSRRLGCIDTDWRPMLEDVWEFAHDFTARNRTLYQDYTVLIIGSTIWDAVGSSPTTKTNTTALRSLVRDLIHRLDQRIPQHVKIIWKSSGWCHNCPWTPKEGLTKIRDNFKVYLANQEAKETIANLTRTRTTKHARWAFVDWGREVLPRSIEHRIMSNDGNPYHYGLVPRLVALQMIAAQYQQWQEEGTDSRCTTLLVSPKKEGISSNMTHWIGNDVLGKVIELQSMTLILLIACVLILNGRRVLQRRRTRIQ